MKLELETYTPREAEAITGVKQETVRNWRRAGHLPRQEGHARYNLADMLVMVAMGMLVSRGVTPEAAKEYSSNTARAIFQSAIWSRKAFSDEVHVRAREEIGEVDEADIQRLMASSEGASRDKATEIAQEIRVLEIMTKAAEKMAGLTGMKHPLWLIVWANGDTQFYYDEDISEETFFGNTSYNEFVRGPVMLFCLGALAQMVIDRLPRPAICLAKDAS